MLPTPPHTSPTHHQNRFNCNVDFMLAGQPMPAGGLRAPLQENATAMAIAEKAKHAKAAARLA